MKPLPKTTISRDTAPTSEPISLSEAKLYLRVDSDVEDAAIGQMIQSAREMAEEMLSRSFIVQRWQLSIFDAAPNVIHLPFGPATNIISVTRYDADANTQTVNAANYQLRDPHHLELDYDSAARTDVLYEAGMASNAAGIPAALKQNMLQHVAYLYGFRSLDDAQRMHDITRLYAPFREVQL